MKVYVVVGCWEYEGHDAPSAVFADRQEAEDYAVAMEDNHSNNSYGCGVLEYEVVAPKTGEGNGEERES